MQTDYENIADLTNKLNQWDLKPDIGPFPNRYHGR